jgi:SAM-dependent methyltransferase
MSKDFGSARHWAAEWIADALFPGARAIDATVGNGHDTLRLCELVGESGRVYGFDVQEDAVGRTRARLSEAGLLNRAELFCAGHERMAEFVREPVDAVVFNLGWLPGAKHAVTTAAETTLCAVSQAAALLKPGGILTICIYPGHEEGRKERDALQHWAAALDPKYDALWKRYLNQKNDPPEMLAVRRRA